MAYGNLQAICFPSQLGKQLYKDELKIFKNMTEVNVLALQHLAMLDKANPSVAYSRFNFLLS